MWPTRSGGSQTLCKKHTSPGGRGLSSSLSLSSSSSSLDQVWSMHVCLPLPQAESQSNSTFTHLHHHHHCHHNHHYHHNHVITMFVSWFHLGLFQQATDSPKNPPVAENKPWGLEGSKIFHLFPQKTNSQVKCLANSFENLTCNKGH